MQPHRWMPFVLALVGCHLGHGSPADRARLPARAEVAVGEHGGSVASVATAGGLRVEVVTRGGGAFAVYTRDAYGLAVGVLAARAEVTEGPAHVPVYLAFVPSDEAFEGRVAGVTPGRHAVTVFVERVDRPGEVAVPFPALSLESVARLPEPAHDGKVVAVGDAMLELSADRCGDLAVYPRGRDGDENGTAAMWVASLRAERDGEVHPGWVVRTHRAFLGRVDPLPAGQVDVVLDFNTHGTRFTEMRVSGVRVRAEGKAGAACAESDAPRLARRPALEGSTPRGTGAGAAGPTMVAGR